MKKSTLRILTVLLVAGLAAPFLHAGANVLLYPFARMFGAPSEAELAKCRVAYAEFRATLGTRPIRVAPVLWKDGPKGTWSRPIAEALARELRASTSAPVMVEPGKPDVPAPDFGHNQLKYLWARGAEYAAWRRSVAVRERDIPRIDEVEIAGLKRTNPEVVRRYVEQPGGAALDTARLNRDLLRAYGDGHYERVDYAVVSRDGRNVLRLFPVEKSWGPDYLRMALRLDSNLSQGSTYLLRLGYQRTWLNTLGGELLLVGELGSSTGASAEFYQPLDSAQRWFVSALAESRRDRSDYFFEDQRIAEYSSARSRVNVGRRPPMTATIAEMPDKTSATKATIMPRTL